LKVSNALVGWPWYLVVHKLVVDLQRQRDLPISLKNQKFFHFFSNLLHFIVLFHRISASKKY